VPKSEKEAFKQTLRSTLTRLSLVKTR
jgi:hypothetical protein